MDGNIFNLSGKTAVISGASRGIGLAIAEKLARCGAVIGLIARSKDRLTQAVKKIETAYKVTAKTFPFDLEKTEKIPDIFAKITHEIPQIDILVNCAGVNIRSAAEEIQQADWDKTIRVNLTAALVMSQQFCLHCRKHNKPGKIINIGSLMCEAARPSTASYAASKGGLLMLTKALAVEWAKYRINVNAVGPGYIETELTAPLKEDKKFDEWVISKTPAGRWGRCDDVAGAALFLASRESDFVTGQIIYVDGGWLAMA